MHSDSFLMKSCCGDVFHLKSMKSELNDYVTFCEELHVFDFDYVFYFMVVILLSFFPKIFTQSALCLCAVKTKRRPNAMQ